MEVNYDQAFGKHFSNLIKDFQKSFKLLRNALKKYIREMKNLKKKKKIWLKNKSLKKTQIDFNGNEQSQNYNCVIRLIIRARNQYVFGNFGNFGNWFPMDIIKLVHESTSK